MAIDTVLEPESDKLPFVPQGEAPPSSFHDEKIDIIALRLWQRSSCLETIGDDCCFCTGEAQRCLAICQ